MTIWDNKKYSKKKIDQELKSNEKKKGGQAQVRNRWKKHIKISLLANSGAVKNIPKITVKARLRGKTV